MTIQQKRINVTNGQDLVFTGRLLGSYTTQNRDSSKTRWTELELWETEGESWIAVSIGKSTERGQVDLVDARVFEHDVDELIEHGLNDTSPLPWAAAVIDFFGWTSAAKAFAREMGWDVTRRVP